MSDLDRITDLKRLRVRGMPQVRLAAVLKAAGLNIHRATVFRNLRNKQEKAHKRTDDESNGLITTVKEHVQQFLYGIRAMVELFLSISCSSTILSR